MRVINKCVVLAFHYITQMLRDSPQEKEVDDDDWRAMLMLVMVNGRGDHTTMNEKGRHILDLLLR